MQQTYETLFNFLSTKPHEPFHLDRYIKFILNCITENFNKNHNYVERHHIAPQSKDMFPEYRSFKEHPWNLSILTYRQHIISHIMLYNIYKTESQVLSILKTSGQPNAKKFNLKSINSKFIEKAKIELSKMRKNRPRNLSDEDRENLSQKLSKIKTEFYSNPENRKKQSEYCKGTTRRKTENFSIASKNRTIEHKNNLKRSINKFYEEKRNNGDTLSLRKMKDGLYITPIGVLSNAYGYSRYCRNPDKKFNNHHIKKNPKLNKNVVGKTPRELGFFFIEKTNPSIQQYYASMNQVHQPEPNHLLRLELNDYLLPKILHH